MYNACLSLHKVKVLQFILAHSFVVFNSLKIIYIKFLLMIIGTILWYYEMMYQNVLLIWICETWKSYSLQFDIFVHIFKSKSLRSFN